MDETRFLEEGGWTYIDITVVAGRGEFALIVFLKPGYFAKVCLFKDPLMLRRPDVPQPHCVIEARGKECRVRHRADLLHSGIALVESAQCFVCVLGGVERGQ